MSGTPKQIKRDFPVAGGSSVSTNYGYQNFIEHNHTVDDIQRLRFALFPVLRDQVIFATTGPGLSVDASAQDVETDNAVKIRHNGADYDLAAAAAIDISALIGQASTVSTSKAGALWIFGNVDGSTMDVEPDKATQAYDSAVEALAQYSIATLTLPPSNSDVPVGVVQVTEGGSGAFTWGTDSITNETETYYSFNGAPTIISELASFAIGTTETAVTYGACKFRLGTGTVVTATGKANVTIGTSTIADGYTGAFILYALADDTEVVVRVGTSGSAVDYASYEAAQRGAWSKCYNPLMPELGILYVTNNSGATFTAGTTALTAKGITATFEIIPAPATVLYAAAGLTAGKLFTDRSIA